METLTDMDQGGGRGFALFYLRLTRRHARSLALSILRGGQLMSVSLKAILAAATVFSAVSAQAQLLGPSWEANIVLTPHDLDLIHAAVTDRVHGKPVGTTVFWKNPASGHSGSITLEKKLILRNQQCEEIAYTIRSSEPGVHPEHYHFTSCLQPDGQWKLA